MATTTEPDQDEQDPERWDGMGRHVKGGGVP